MTLQNEFKFKVAINAPDIHPEWVNFHQDCGSIDPQQCRHTIDTWRGMIAHICAVVQTIPDGGCIAFKWNDVEALINESERLMQCSSSPTNYTTPPSFCPPQFVFECTLMMEGPQTGRDVAALQLNRFMYALFLAMNLSQPGSFDLNDAAIPGNAITSFGEERPWTLSCEALKGLQRDWAPTKHIPFDRTWRWVSKMDVGLKLLAPGKDEYSTERVLLALLHALSVGLDPVQRVWVSHSLEAMFCTPRASILHTLENRILLVLRPASHQNKLKKAVRDFYDVRSEFVHGDLPVLHPAIKFDSALRLTESGFVGQTEADLQNKIKTTAQDALAILIAALQELIAKDWKRFDFRDEMTGIPLNQP